MSVRVDPCLAGGGEAGALMRAMDWSATPLGPVETWPHSLRTMIGVILASRFAMRLIWGPEFIFLYNDGYRPILGEKKHPGAMGSRTPESFREVWHIVGPMFARVFNGESVGLEDTLLPLERNGYLEECYFTLSYSPVRDDQGAVGGVLGVVAETTDRVLAERRLRTLRQLASYTAPAKTPDAACAFAVDALIDNRADVPFALFYLIEPDGTHARLGGVAGLAEGSKAAPRRVPLDATPGTGWPLADTSSGRTLIVEDLTERFGPIHAGLYLETVHSAVVLPLTRRGLVDPYGFFIAGVNPRKALDEKYEGFFELAAEHVVAAIANAVALEEQARVQGAAQEHTELERKRLHSFLMEAPAAIAILRGRSFVFELSNPRYDEIVGHRDIVGKPGREALPELASQGVWEILDRIYTTGEPFIASEFPVQLDRRGDGALEEGFFNWIGQTTHDAYGTIDGVMLFAVEVSDQVHARQHVERSRAREEDLRIAAEAANRAKDEFLAMLGHELRNPLAPMTTALHLMRLRAGDVCAKERVVIERQVEHLTRLVDDLLDVSRITRGRVELETTRIEIAGVVATAIEIASPLLEQRQQHLTVNIPTNGLAVEGDATRLAQVFSNLLTNAAKYTPAGGWIVVTAEQMDAEVVVEVRDNGIGIAPGILPAIFDLFVQERQAIDRSQGGLGLGLAIVRSLVLLHGGTVSATSEGTGRGSVFTVRLPWSASPLAIGSPTRSADPPHDAASAPEGRRILVVDDNEDAADMLASGLRLMGYVTLTAHDGPSALHAASEFHPEVALLDIGLPVMDGYEVARRLKNATPDRRMHLIAVTGYGQDTDRARSLQAGFDAHVVKPVKLAEIEALIRELVDAG